MTPNFASKPPQTTFEAEAVVVATGGLSIPKMGATGSRLPPRRTVRPAHRRVQTCSGATRLQPGGPRPMVRPVRRLNRSHRKCRDTQETRQLSRKDADHASRLERPGDPADLVLLATRRRRSRSIWRRNTEVLEPLFASDRKTRLPPPQRWPFAMSSQPDWPSGGLPSINPRAGRTPP